MADSKVTIIAIVAVAAVVITGCVIALNGGEHKSDSGTFIFNWGPGTSMSYDIDGGYIRNNPGHDVICILGGSTENHEIISATESQFTFQRDVMMKETHIDPSTGKTETKTSHQTITVNQDREFRYSGAVTSTIDTQWGTKDVLVQIRGH